MTARLTLICHAATEAVRLGRFPADEDLQPGAAAALTVAVRSRAGDWRSGPELRARATAKALSGHDVEVETALRDWDLGVWAGRTLPEIAATDADGLAHWLADPSVAPHGGESHDALLARVAGFMTAAAGRGGRSVAVTHPAVVRAAIVTALGAEAAAFWRIDAPPLVHVRLSHDGRRWVLQALTPPDAGIAADTR